MFIVLLLGSLLLSLAVTFIAARIFKQPIAVILERIISEEISFGWARYIIFSIYVAGVSSGTRVWELERYINPSFGGPGREELVLNADRIVLESYRTIISALQGVSSVLLVFFVVTLIAYVAVRVFESKKERHEEKQSQS